MFSTKNKIQTRKQNDVLIIYSSIAQSNTIKHKPLKDIIHKKHCPTIAKIYNNIYKIIKRHPRYKSGQSSTSSMNPRMYLSVLVCVAIISTAMTATTTNKRTKKEKNASSTSSTSSTAVSLLAFQPARGCTIRKETSTRGTTSYHLVGTVGRKATVLFSDRPARVAKNVATQTFVNNFDTMFVSSKPNTVISFTNKEDDPLIVVITRASILQTNEEDGSLVLEYDIEQQGSQDEVSSIDQFVGLDHQHCSIFVDDFTTTSWSKNVQFTKYDDDGHDDDDDSN